MFSFKQFFTEIRFNDKEYYNPESPWRLTADEYLKVSNKSNKFHPSDAYEPKSRKVITRENPPIKDTIKIHPDPRGDGFRQLEWIDSKNIKRYYGGVPSYQVPNIERAYDYILYYASGDIIDTKEYIDYHFQYHPHYTVNNYPHKIQTKNGVDYRYNKKDKVLMAFIDNKPIGMATDEWGAYLVQVDPKYRNRGIGSNLAHLFLAINKRDSGGYTIHGHNMALSLHKKAVKDALKLGWYDRAINDGFLTKEKVKDILNT